VFRKDVDVLLERSDVGSAFLFRQPPPQRFERPDIADASLLLDDRMDRGDRV
jgi:hypothetical protein